MKRFLSSALALSLAACSSVQTHSSFDTPETYIPKHPELSLPAPQWTPVTLKEAQVAAGAIEYALTGAEKAKHPELTAFVEIVGNMFINAHRAEIMACTDARGNRAGPGMADPECVWPRPAADWWMGCMVMQFGPETISTFKPSTIGEDSPFIWIDKHYDEVVKQPGGEDYLIKLNGIPELAVGCEKMLQESVKPEGALDV